MTKEELDKQIVEKKLAKLNEDDRRVLRDYFHDGWALPHNFGISDAVSKNLHDLGLIKNVKKIACLDGTMREAPYGLFFYQLTNFGKMVREKLTPKCPF